MPGSGREAETEALPPEPYPLIAEARRALAAAATPPAGWRPLGTGAAGYLSLTRDICVYFREHQDERGAIVDPYEGDERQYATPCYAVAAALVALDGRPPAGVWGAARRAADEPPRDAALLESGARAQDHALRSLAVENSTAQAHADFFAPLVVLGYQLLAPFAGRERAARWLAELRSIDPESTYHQTFSARLARGQSAIVHNWNVVAVAGEMLRHVAGAGSASSWITQYLDHQLSEHADLEWGLYRDPGTPLPYDLFPRHHLGYALAAGFDAGDRAATLAAWLHRGEWTSALTQTASGGIPPGWRSSEHLWNDAALVALGEVAAARHARAGRRVAAGLFRRVAVLAFRDMLHWRRPSGELYVVKNHFDPALRHGFERYSFHSNYGLYPAAMLATAVLFGDCATPEAPAPVETGARVIRYPNPFHQLVATCRGISLAFDLDADGHYDVTGLNSVRRLGAHPLLGPASGIPAHPRYHVPEPPGAASGAGFAWTGSDGAPSSLAGLRPRAVDLRIERAEAGDLVFSLRYLVQAAGCEAITSHYRIDGTGIRAEERFEGAPSARDTLAFVWPFPVDDGRDRAEATLEAGQEGAALRVRLGEAAQRVTVHGAATAVEPRRVAHRNGYAAIARSAIAAGGTVWSLEYEP